MSADGKFNGLGKVEERSRRTERRIGGMRLTEYFGGLKKCGGAPDDTAVCGLSARAAYPYAALACVKFYLRFDISAFLI